MLIKIKIKSTKSTSENKGKSVVNSYTVPSARFLMTSNPCIKPLLM